MLCVCVCVLNAVDVHQENILGIADIYFTPQKSMFFIFRMYSKYDKYKLSMLISSSSRGEGQASIEDVNRLLIPCTR